VDCRGASDFPGCETGVGRSYVWALSAPDEGGCTWEPMFLFDGPPDATLTILLAHGAGAPDGLRLNDCHLQRARRGRYARCAARIQLYGEGSSSLTSKLRMSLLARAAL
jgi:hypothetical protein